MDKAFILDEIRRMATENDGRPLGVAAFRGQTGIRNADWQGIHWVRWSDALIEAGFNPNKFTAAIDDNDLAKKYIDLARELGHLPVEAELRMKRRVDKSFPSDGVFRRFGSKQKLIRFVSDYCRSESKYDDVAGWCDDYLLRSPNDAKANGIGCRTEETPLGCVYLAKSGRFYKIGKSNSVGRREYELAIQLPEKLKMIHVITTDDPTGIEAYWHKRFESNRKNGEWLELGAKDVAAFKRRRKFM